MGGMVARGLRGLCVDIGVNGWPLNLKVLHILKLLYAKKRIENQRKIKYIEKVRILLLLFGLSRCCPAVVPQCVGQTVCCAKERLSDPEPWLTRQ